MVNTTKKKPKVSQTPQKTQNQREGVSFFKLDGNATCRVIELLVNYIKKNENS